LGPFEEILVLVGDHQNTLTSAIKWAGQLDVPLKIKAYEALYEQIKFKGFTDKPEVLCCRFGEENQRSAGGGARRRPGPLGRLKVQTN
jgi:hypothetical protein